MRLVGLRCPLKFNYIDTEGSLLENLWGWSSSFCLEFISKPQDFLSPKLLHTQPTYQKSINNPTPLDTTLKIWKSFRKNVINFRLLNLQSVVQIFKALRLNFIQILPNLCNFRIFLSNILEFLIVCTVGSKIFSAKNPDTLCPFPNSNSFLILTLYKCIKKAIYAFIIAIV